MHVDMVSADYALEYLYVLGVADLHEQVPATQFDVTRQHMVTVLRDPDDMGRQPCDGVPAMPVIAHRARLLSCGRSG